MRHWTYASRHHDPVGQVGGDEAEVLFVPGIDSIRGRFSRACHEQGIVDDSPWELEIRGATRCLVYLFGGQRHALHPRFDLFQDEDCLLGLESVRAGSFQ